VRAQDVRENKMGRLAEIQGFEALEFLTHSVAMDIV
jgi:hypothetical protein